jgi:hypothetical protein
MKNITYSTAVFILATCMLGACGDEHVYFTKTRSSGEGAKVKFVHAASDALGVNFYVNGAKVSSGAAAGSTIAYAASFPGTNYSILTPGVTEVKVLIPETLTTPQSVLVTSNIDTDDDTYYTVALAGVTPNYETVLINDDLSSIPYDGKTYVRFVNLIHNTTNNLKVVATINVGTPPAPVTTVIAENIAYKQTSGFIALDPGDYTIQLKDGTTDAVIATANAATKLVAGNRTYTLFGRGQIGMAGAAAPALDRMTNR